MTVIELIQERTKQSGGHCGITPVEIAQSLQMSMDEVKKELNHLYRERKIQVRDGAQGKLLLIQIP